MPNPAPGNRKLAPLRASLRSQAAKRSAPAPQVRPCAIATVRTGARQTASSSASIRAKRSSRSPSDWDSSPSRSKPVQKCRPAPANIRVWTDGSRKALCTASSAASTNSLLRALPRCARLISMLAMPSLICSRIGTEGASLRASITRLVCSPIAGGRVSSATTSPSKRTGQPTVRVCTPLGRVIGCTSCRWVACGSDSACA